MRSDPHNPRKADDDTRLSHDGCVRTTTTTTTTADALGIEVGCH